jgi:hypothetical protein
MLARVCDRPKLGAIVLFLFALTSLVSCVTRKEQVRLVNDPSEHPESAIPWNRQEKWELGAGIPDALIGGGTR